MNNVYQKIEFIFNSPNSNVSNFEQNVAIELINDYSYDDIIEAFIRFSQCIGFEMTRENVIEYIKRYIEYEN